MIEPTDSLKETRNLCLSVRTAERNRVRVPYVNQARNIGSVARMCAFGVERVEQLLCRRVQMCIPADYPPVPMLQIIDLRHQKRSFR